MRAALERKTYPKVSVLCVECDSHPVRARRELERVFGRAMLVVASGGQWTDPDTGEVQNKLHLYFRLKKPATGKELARKIHRELAGVAQAAVLA